MEILLHMIYHNTIVTQEAVYLENNSLLLNSQRISTEQPQHYWQQANSNLTLSKNLSPNKIVKEAIYIGRIPLHFGHFLIEGLSRMTELPFLNLPFIGYLTPGNLPPNIYPMKESEARTLIKLITKNTFIELKENDQTLVETLYFNPPPMTLSHTVHDPVRMSKLIQHIVKDCKSLHPMKEIDHLTLNRHEDPLSENSNNPNDPITLQIAKVANCKKLSGKAGSNTHLSMFANQKTITEFIPRNDPEQTDRNQLLCDLIRMYNI